MNQQPENKYEAQEKIIDFLMSNVESCSQQRQFGRLASMEQTTSIELTITSDTAIELKSSMSHQRFVCTIIHSYTQSHWGFGRRGLESVDAPRGGIELDCWELSSMEFNKKAYIFGKTIRGEMKYITFHEEDDSFRFDASDVDPEDVDIDSGSLDPRVLYYTPNGSSGWLSTSLNRNLYAKLNPDTEVVTASYEAENWTIRKL